MRELMAPPMKTAKAYANSGPGPKNLTRGDLNFGFFGLLNPGEFVTVYDLAAACGLTVDATPPENPTWVKYVEKGIVKYMPLSYIFLSYTWNQLYSAGAVFGDDTEGVTPRYPSSLAAVKQSARITVNGSKLKIRIPGKGDTDPSTISGTNQSPTALTIASAESFEYARMAVRLFDGKHAAFANSWRVTRPGVIRVFPCIPAYTRSGSPSSAYLLSMIPPQISSTVAAGTVQAYTSETKLTRMGWTPLLELDQPALT